MKARLLFSLFRQQLVFLIQMISISAERDSPTFFTTTIPLYPSGVQTLRRLQAKYDDCVLSSVNRLEKRRQGLAMFVCSEDRATGSLSQDAQDRSIFAAQRIEEKVARVMKESAVMYEANACALRTICCTFDTVQGIAPFAEYQHHVKLPKGGAERGDESVNGVLARDEKRFVLVEKNNAVPAVNKTAEEASAGSYDSPLQILAHIARDWSAEGASSRKELYGPVVTAMCERFAGGRGDVEVLVPGSGAGRLAWELTDLGFRVLANDGGIPLVVSLLMCACLVWSHVLFDAAILLCSQLGHACSELCHASAEANTGSIVSRSRFRLWLG